MSALFVDSHSFHNNILYGTQQNYLNKTNNTSLNINILKCSICKFGFELEYPTELVCGHYIHNKCNKIFERNSSSSSMKSSSSTSNTSQSKILSCANCGEQVIKKSKSSPSLLKTLLQKNNAAFQ